MIPLADHNPTKSPPVLTWLAIGLCVVAYIGQTTGPFGFEWSIYAYGFIPARLFEGAQLPPEAAVAAPWQTVFTSMFMHGSLAHIGGNMLYLWVFGDNIENDLGKPKFLLFYLLCGVAAAMAQGFTDTSSAIPMVGASGAIAGVLGAYLVLHPKQSITVFVPQFGLTQMPALTVLGMWFVYQVILGLANMGGEGGGVAFMAHVGGFLAGVILIKILHR